jgi:hypothetical protein
MNKERKYSEKEISAIFKKAAEAQESARDRLPDGEGLTLAELQQIGQETGITGEFIARAAAEVDRTDTTPPVATYMGIPVSAAYASNLPGSFSDKDWDRLVVDLRETFHASGKISRDGSLRQWSNGNLRVLIEPTEEGHRIRMRSLNGNLRSSLFGGLAIFTVGLLIALAEIISGDPAMTFQIIFLASIVVAGLGTTFVSAARIKGWRKLRERQMREIAARAIDRHSDRLEKLDDRSERIALQPGQQIDILPSSLDYRPEDEDEEVARHDQNRDKT